MGIKKYSYIHKIVAEAFLGPCPDGREVNHKNGVKTDNSLTNLEYLTPSENVKHALRLGLRVMIPNTLKARGESHAYTKLTELQVISILELSAAGVNDCEIARRFPSMARRSICNITNRKTWKHVQLGPRCNSDWKECEYVWND